MTFKPSLKKIRRNLTLALIFIAASFQFFTVYAELPFKDAGHGCCWTAANRFCLFIRLPFFLFRIILLLLFVGGELVDLETDRHDPKDSNSWQQIYLSKTL